jgi:hypothetical protein
VKELHRQDLARRCGKVYLPFALKRKYPNAERAWIWQYVFPATKPSLDPRSGEIRRHHVSEKNLQNAVKLAIRAAGIKKAASCHTFRAFVCDPPARKRLRYSHRSRTARAQECGDDDDIHTCPEPAGNSYPQPTRPKHIWRLAGLGIMLDEKMFAFYYELSSNSR